MTRPIPPCDTEPSAAGEPSVDEQALDSALDRLRVLAHRHEELNRKGMEAYRRNDTLALDAIVEEEDRLLSEKRKLVDQFLAVGSTLRTIAVPSPGESDSD